MRNQNLTYEEVLRIVELVKATQFSEFRLKVGEIEVHLRRKDAAAAPQVAAVQAAVAPAATAATPAGHSAERSFPPDVVLVRSPMVGTVYRAPAPGAAAFVEVGQRVEPDSTICIIEVMKLMNSIAAGVRGVISEIVVANGEAVEYGQPLIAIRPDAGDA